MDQPLQDSSAQPASKPRRRWLRRVLYGGLGTIGATALTGAGVGYFISVPPYRGPRSDHFDGDKFFNPGGAPQRGFSSLLSWLFNREEGPWDEFTEMAPAPPPPRRIERGALRATMVNHSTVLLQFDGLNILTDPVWSERVSPFSWIGPRRHAPPGIRFDDLPPIDVVLLSHNHYDHLDIDTVEKLAEQHHPKFFAPLGVGSWLRDRGLPGVQPEMDWWERLPVADGVELHCVPAHHFSGRGLFDRDTTLWCGYMLESQSSGRIFFAGDSAEGPHYAEIAKRFPGIRFALLPIGAYRPEWFMKPVHMSPQGAVNTHHTLSPEWSMGIHFGTFAQADDGQREPIDTLNTALDAAAIPRDRFRALANGEGWEVG